MISKETWSPGTPDVRRVLEAIYAFEVADATSWLEGIEAAVRPALDGAMLLMLDVHYSDGAGGQRFLAVVPRPPPAALDAAGSPDQAQRALTLPPVGFAKHLLDEGVTMALPDLVDSGLIPAMPRDVFVVHAYGGDTCGATIAAPIPTIGHAPPAVLERWARISAHFAAATRLRVSGRPKPDLVLDPKTWRAVDASDIRADTRDALRTAARAIDKLRGRKVTDAGEALGVWRVLNERRWTIADEFDRDGRRYVVAYDNAPTAPATLPQLSLGERQVVCLAALGHTNKLIAYELGIGASTVAARLASAMKKLGARSRATLIRIVLGNKAVR